MRELGYAEEKNIHIEWRFAETRLERLPGLAAELVHMNVDVIVAGQTAAAKAAQDAPTTIPVVIGYTSDPIGTGLVSSLAHPQGNITGVAALMTDMTPKHLELLMTVVPNLTRVAVLVNQDHPGG